MSIAVGVKCCHPCTITVKLKLKCKFKCSHDLKSLDQQHSLKKNEMLAPNYLPAHLRGVMPNGFLYIKDL